MTEKSATEIRLDLARGHRALGEHDEAVACLERCASADESGELHEFATGYVNDLHERGHRASAERLARLLAAWDEAARQSELDDSDDDVTRAIGGPALATPTLAALLADQGHTARALAVAEDALRLRPGDPRARALAEGLRAAQPEAFQDPGSCVSELERWLKNARQRAAEWEARR